MVKRLPSMEFCDLAELQKIITDWSTITHMKAVTRAADDEYVPGMCAFSKYCELIRSSEKGIEACRSCEGDSYSCHAGLFDFSVPVTLPDGCTVATIFCGQVRLEGASEPDFRTLAEKTGVLTEELQKAYRKLEVRTGEELRAAKSLLDSAVRNFVEKSWETRMHRNESAADKTLSQITQMLYAYNITLDLSTGEYTLITGTGMERTVEIFKAHTDFVTAKRENLEYVHPAYQERLMDLIGLDALRAFHRHTGHIDTMEYPVLYPDENDYRWHEVNVFLNEDENGKTVANILGRDVTEAHELQERNNREIKAAADRNRILSNLTKMLYSYNLTLNLNTGKYSLIEGTGMEGFRRLFRATDDYPTVCEDLLKHVLPEYADQVMTIAGMDALRRRKSQSGFIGNMEYGAVVDNLKEWYEINVFVSTDEFGTPIANILGRDITEAHKRMEQRELEQKAAAARDQLLSGMTKMLYSFNVSVNLKTWKYSLITGTGCEAALQVIEGMDDYVLGFRKLRNMVEAESRSVLDNLCGVHALMANRDRSGFIGTVVTSAMTERGKQWQEVNLFMGSNEYGEPIANILGRDITAAHERQVNRERELRAASARDQLLSGVTKMLYSYNMTVNVDTEKYTLITGTGLDDTVEAMQTSDDFEEIFERFKKRVVPGYLERGIEFLSLDTYREGKGQSGYIGTEEFPEITPKGIEWHEINIFTGVDDEGSPIVNILGRDVTEAHDRADTKAQLEIAEASSMAKTKFLFNMSHDIRTPMNAIIGFTDLLAKHLDDRTLAESYIEKIRYSNEFLLSLINNVLEMARIESGKESLDETSCDAVGFMESIGTVFDSQMKEKGLTFERTIRVEHTATFCDTTKLREVFLNLLSNALKYTPAGGRVCMDTVELPSEMKGYVLYKTVVSDTGIGMSKEFLPHLFEEFSREKNSTESRVIGTGLGMPIVKNLVKLMQGEIRVESELGRGTVFTVTIPHRLADEVREEATQETTTEQEVNFEGRRILLAEDNELNAEIAVSILEEAGFEVEHAEDGVVCVSMLERAKPHYYDLILMDIQMPNLDGYGATKRIRAFEDPEKAGIPIIAMTANAFDEDKRNAVAAGMNGHLAKPIVIPKLMETLKAILAKG